MGNIVVMTWALVVLCAVALLFHVLIRVNMGEGMLLSAAYIAAALYIGSCAGTFAYGMTAIYAAAIVGGLLWIIKLTRQRKTELLSVLSVSFVIFVLLYLSYLVLYYHDFIQHIDEFHEWAAAVKYMLTNDRMPTGVDFIGGGGQYCFATSLFHLFFQKISGYNEQNMYVSSSMLIWIGLLLPFSGYEWKNWKKPVLYAVLMYVALYSLYGYGLKSIYVDMPTAAWAGGLAGWWIHRKKEKTNYTVLAAGLIMLYYFKPSAGLLMAVLVVGFAVLQTWFLDKEYLEKKKGMRNFSILVGSAGALLLAGCIILLIFCVKIQPYNAGSAIETAEETLAAPEMQRWAIGGYVLPDQLSSRINTFGLSKEKTLLTLGTFAARSIGGSLSGRSNLKLSFLAVVFLVVLLVKTSGELYGEKKKCTGYICYMVLTAASYLAVLFFSYLFMFAYELSINARSTGRYYSICCVYLFVIALSILLQPASAKHETCRKYLTYGLILFFILGLNNKYIPNATALQKTEVSYYKKISSTKRKVQKISNIIEDTDKVYLIHQFKSNSLGKAELINAPALYYMDNQVSNYLVLPWRFIEEGCNIRQETFETMSIIDLPNLLAQNGFTYVWIHTADDYLKENLPKVMKCDEVKGSKLYKIIYENGAATGLEAVCSVK